MISNNKWKRYLYALHLQGAKNGKKVKSLDYQLIAKDIKGSFNITDLQIQDGSTASGTIPHTSDFLEVAPFSIDQDVYMNPDSAMSVQPNQKLGNIQPDDSHVNVINRFFNFVGRGHEAIVIPNVFHEDYSKPIVTSAVDLTIHAKDDYDLVRISTNNGAFSPRFYTDLPDLVLEKNSYPLNYQYTREFWFDGGKAGDTIELLTTVRTAQVTDSNQNMTDFGLVPQSFNIDGRTFSNNRQRLMLAPSGSFRIRIEFYKNAVQHYQVDFDGNKVKDDKGNYVPDFIILGDTGIGYYGIAELTQWTNGVSKL